MTSLLLGSEFDEPKVKPLLAAFDNATEWTKHLDKINLLEGCVQVAYKQSVIQAACGVGGNHGGDQRLAVVQLLHILLCQWIVIEVQMVDWIVLKHHVWRHHWKVLLQLLLLLLLLS